MRVGVGKRIFVGAAIAVFCISAQSIAAGSMNDIAAVVGSPHSEEWRTAFTEELDKLGASARIAGASYDTSVTVFSGQKLEGTPGEAARLVFEVVVRVDRELRRGGAPGRVVLDARRTVERLSEGEQPFGENARLRLRRQLHGLGTIIYGELGRRYGPQNGPGTHGGSSGAGPSGGGARGKTGQTGSVSGEEISGY